MAESEIFRRMLDESPLAEEEDIPVIESDPETFINFLKCIYGGTDFVVKKLSYERCMSLLYLCEKYLTLEIQDSVTSEVLQKYNPLSIDHVITSLSSPACISNPSNKLTEAISQVIQNNTEEILNHKYFLDLDTNAVEFISKQDKISTAEINLWKAVYKWAEKKAGSEDPKDARSLLRGILKHIRFCTMDANDFCTSVVPSKVLTVEEVFDINMSIGTKIPPKLDGFCGQILDRMKTPTSELTFVHVFHNIKGLTGTVCSNKYRLGEFNWYIEISKHEGNKIGAYVTCSSASNKRSWKCHAKYTIKLVNQLNNKPNLIASVEKQSTEFSSEDCVFDNSCSWGCRNMINFGELIKAERGFIKNNAIEMIATVRLT